MVTHMKTTVEISGPLLAEAKTLSSQERTTLRALIEEGLREVIVKHRKEKRFRLRKVTFRGQGLRPEFQGASWDEIRDAVYERRGG